MTKKTKILFLHNTAMWYRLPFFKKISKIYELELVFTHINIIEKIYDKKLETEIPELNTVNYTILKNNHGFAKGLIKKIRQNHDIVVGGSWDTPQELIETIIIFITTKIQNTPFIIWREDWNWKKKESLKEKILTIIIKYISKNVQGILVPGSLHKEYFQGILNVPSENIHIMPNVSNIKDTTKNVKKEENILTILYVGRLIKRKGVTYLINAYSKLENKLPNTQLIIIGTGPEETKLKKQAKNKNILFTGKIENDKLQEYYKKSDLVVVPSTFEGMGDPWVFILNEAMYFNNPIIATDAVGAAPDMIQNNGFIIPEQNSEELFKAMYKILNNKNTLKKMSDNSKNIITDKFQYVHMINAFKTAITYTLKKKK